VTTAAEAANLAIVRRYFEEVLDGGKSMVMAEIFANGAVQHFPGRTLTFSVESPPADYTNRQFRTTLHHFMADGDYVVAHLTHAVQYGEHARYPTRIGPVDVGGRSVHWDAMALFHLQNGKIVEEWVSRDELDILNQLGAIQVTTAS
jgi:hypothetical protein